MSLPEESVAVNTLPEVTTIPTGKKLIFTDPDTNEGGSITLKNLTKQILQNLTSQTFALDQGNLTLLQALNQLNSKAVYSFTVTISEEQIAWKRISGTNIVLKAPQSEYILLDAINPDTGVIRKIYISRDGELFNCTPALTPGIWYINGSYVSK